MPSLFLEKDKGLVGSRRGAWRNDVRAEQKEKVEESEQQVLLLDGRMVEQVDVRVPEDVEQIIVVQHKFDLAVDSSSWGVPSERETRTRDAADVVKDHKDQLSRGGARIGCVQAPISEPDGSATRIAEFREKHHTEFVTLTVNNPAAMKLLKLTANRGSVSSTDSEGNCGDDPSYSKGRYFQLH